MKNNLKKFTEAYKECIIMGSIDPDELKQEQEQMKLINEEAKKLEEQDNLLLESHGVALTTVDKEIVAKESWTLFELLYEYIGGYKSYASVKDMVDSSAFLNFVYDGPLNDIKDFKIEKCVTVGTYNKNHGLKMTSIASNIVCFPKQYTRAAARKLQRESLKWSWCEVSGKAEEFLIKLCGAKPKYLIKPEIIQQVYPDIIPDTDGEHYNRIIKNLNKSIRKIAFGTIKI